MSTKKERQAARAIAHKSEWRKKLRARQAQAMSVIDRLKEHPPELLDQVLEAVVESFSITWRPSDYPRDYIQIWSWVEPSIEMGLNDFFEWPPTIEQGTREMLNQRAAPILLNKAIIELPARFMIRGSIMVLDVPKAIRGREHDVRYLVFDLLIASGDEYQAELNQMITHMGSIRALFPRLQSCVICILFIFPYIVMPSPFAPRMLSRDNRTGYTQAETPRVSLSKLVSTFHTSGPGIHKFVRFGQQIMKRGSSCYLGPLVDVTSIAATISGELSDGSTAHSDAGSSLAEQVLERADCYYRDGRKRIDVV